MKRLSILLVLLLAACGNKTNVQPDHVASVQEAPDYGALTKQQLTAYFKVLPAALNAKDYKRIERYIQPQSKAAEYIKQTMATDRFDHYTIKRVTIDKVSVKGTATEAVVTRIMSSRATKEQLTTVVTVFDMRYDKAARQMRITDFNDSSVQVSKSDAETCVMSGLKSQCSGLTEHELKQSYNKLVTSGRLPQSALTDCLNCAIKDSLAIQAEKSAAQVAGPMTVQEAVALVDRTYRTRVEQAQGTAVTFTYHDSQPAADAGGKYYAVQATAGNQLVQSFKVYLHSHEIIAE
ncbi:TcaA NTF2-like domain-containing protein [Macrococcus equipercicus]|uniref:TcaA protein NTF2-like domain-containing protein n=1 Tax=Macrococcus equipercicus TaxID=69967 RepID=A0A9Q9F1R4_9STAP|nr:hypothetical protein [Macrococcus equipercicus]KAA1039325.1 hypothetical protein ERX35_007065 [Macrococcus equipercicus]UTH13616.1 hypothetical protein KFV11_10395 [Macrococcus equipercicus]